MQFFFFFFKKEKNFNVFTFWLRCATLFSRWKVFTRKWFAILSIFSRARPFTPRFARSITRKTDVPGTLAAKVYAIRRICTCIYC